MNDIQPGDTIGVALIGFGFAGHTFHAPFITTTPGLALRAVVTSQASRVAAEYPDAFVTTSPADAIQRDDVQLVVVATPNDSHATLAEAALRAGRHVVVDKPFTVTLDEARAVVATAEATGRLLSVYQNRRFDSDFLGVEREIRAGTIGEVVEFHSEISRWRPIVRDRWRERAGPGAGLWYDLGPHLVHQALTLFGEPDGVQATLRALRPGGVTDDWFHVRLDYPTRQVLLTSSMLGADAVPRFRVRGTGGALVKAGMDVQERRLMAGERPGPADWGHDDDPVIVHRDGEAPRPISVPAGSYGRFYAGMRDAIRDGSPLPVTPAMALLVMAIIAAGVRSSASGRTERAA